MISLLSPSKRSHNAARPSRQQCDRLSWQPIGYPAYTLESRFKWYENIKWNSSNYLSYKLQPLFITLTLFLFLLSFWTFICVKILCYLLFNLYLNEVFKCRQNINHPASITNRPKLTTTRQEKSKEFWITEFWLTCSPLPSPVFSFTPWAFSELSQLVSSLLQFFFSYPTPCPLFSKILKCIIMSQLSDHIYSWNLNEPF